MDWKYQGKPHHLLRKLVKISSTNPFILWFIRLSIYPFISCSQYNDKWSYILLLIKSENSLLNIEKMNKQQAPWYLRWDRWSSYDLVKFQRITTDAIIKIALKAMCNQVCWEQACHAITKISIILRLKLLVPLVKQRSLQSIVSKIAGVLGSLFDRFQSSLFSSAM